MTPSPAVPRKAGNTIGAIDRRTFLRLLGAASSSAALASVLAACGRVVRPVASATRLTQPKGRVSRSSVREIDGLPVADWVVEENASPHATRGWIIPRRITGTESPPIEGFVDNVSYRAGDDITLRVNTISSSFHAEVYRIGYYGGAGGRRVAVSPELPGRTQKAPTLVADVNTIECDWVPSWRTKVADSWPPGAYLIKLTGSRNEQQYVPFTVRDDSSHAAFVLQSSVTTWQAYNPFGGYSFYGGPATPTLSDYENRARIVSFDRPYSHDATALDARGSGDFMGNELPFIYLAERYGLDLTYSTDVDLDRNPKLLLNHRCLISLGHDEYWSMTMRNATEDAIAKGVNVAFLGANACYRQIRFASSSVGDHRKVICYKDAEEDPITKTDPALATGGSWATDPISRPESSLIGIMYYSYGGSGPLVVADGSSWIFEGTGLETNDEIPRLIGSEFDRFEPGAPHPSGVEILGHSPTNSVSGASYSDLSYYAASGGAGVFASGTGTWVTALWDGVGRTPTLLGFGVDTGRVKPVTGITMNVLRAFGSQSAGMAHPSMANWRQFYSPGGTVLPTADVP